MLDTAIVALDRDGTILTWNAGAQAVFGHRRDEIIGKHLGALYPAEAVARGKPAQDLREAAQAGSHSEEAWCLRSDGARFWGAITLSAMHDGNGPDRGLAFVARDATAQRRAQEGLQQAFADLEAFSFTVSHDLRAPLRAMEQLIEITLADAKGLDDSSRQNLDAVRRSSQQAIALVEDLLRFARAGRGDLTRVDVDLGAVARASAHQVQQRWPHPVTLQVRDEPLKTYADAGMLRLMLDQLLGNSWKFTQRRLGDARVEVGRGRHGEEVVFFVRDNGVGFPPQKAETIFQPFHRLHGPNEFAGTGIGLATVRRIVERHGGRAWAEGQEGAGATIYFTLPPEPGSRRTTHS